MKHKATGQLRAAKEFHSQMRESRFRELQTLRHLKHPALPGIFDVLEEGECCWLIMEYIDGQSLSRLRSEQPSEHEFFDRMEQLLTVMEYLHNQTPPVLHLDLKPSNLMLDRRKHLFLIDFGASVRLTRGGEDNPCTGTPGFAAPEQMNPDSCIDTRADVYGCGAIMYWYLYGQVPVCAEDGTVRQPVGSGGQHLWERKIWRVIRQCLRADPSDRFTDAAVLRKKLIQIQRDCSRRKKWRNDFAAFLFLILFLLFCAVMQVSEQEEQKNSIWIQYRQELEQAESFGIEQAAECYRRAAVLCPDEFEWCLRLAERICADYCLDAQEETVVRQLLYSAAEGETQTNLERMQQQPENYRQFCYQMGIAYWYFYEESGGKHAAVSWFSRVLQEKPMQTWEEEWEEGQTGAENEKAAGSQDENQSEPNQSEPNQSEPNQNDQELNAALWETARILASAKYHVKIGAYYDELNRTEELGKSDMPYGVYWEDLCALWSLEAIVQEELPVRRQIAEELISGITVNGYQLKVHGITYKQVKNILGELEHFFEAEKEEQQIQQIHAARKEAKRVYNRGNKTLDTTDERDHSE